MTEQITQNGDVSNVLQFEGKIDVINQMLAGTEFSPACDAVNPGTITLLVTATATGPQAKTETFARLLPDGQSTKVIGTNDKKLYFASHQMSAFSTDNKLPVYGRVVDLAGAIINNPGQQMSVDVSQTYGKGCLRTVNVPVSGGFFETEVWRMSDKRSFKSKVKLNSGSDYLKIEQQLDYGNFIDSSELFMQVQTVSTADRVLAGVYRFRAINAVEYTPTLKLGGEYTLSSKEAGSWTSNEIGEVLLEHLKVGLTNVVLNNNPTFFNTVINGAKVFKAEEKKPDVYGRPMLLVPRDLDREILLTLSWIGKEF